MSGKRPDSAARLLHVNLFVRLHDHEAIALKAHLHRLPGAAAEEGAQRNVGLQFRRETAAPRDGRVRIGHQRPAGLHAQGQRLVVAGDRQQATALEADVEQTAGHHADDLFHHGDLVLEARLEGENVVAVHHQRLVFQAEDDDLLPLVGEVEFSPAVSVGQAHPFAGKRALEQAADAVVEHAFAGELDVAVVGGHRAGLGIHPAVEVDLEEARRFQFEDPVAEVALGGADNEFLKTFGGIGGEGGWCGPHLIKLARPGENGHRKIGVASGDGELAFEIQLLIEICFCREG